MKPNTITLTMNGNYLNKWDIAYDGSSHMIVIKQEPGILTLRHFNKSKYRIINAIKILWLKIMVYLRVIK